MLAKKWPIFVLAAIVFVAAAVIAYYAQRYHLRQVDEMQSVSGARWLADNFPSGLWSDQIGPRGPERLTAFVLALINAFVHTTADQFTVGHYVLPVLWAMTAVPTYLLARGVGLSPAAGLVASTLAVVGPWSVFGVTFLNTSLGYLTFTILLLAMWNTVLRPSKLADGAVLAAFCLAALARYGHAPFVLALAPAILLHSWRTRPQTRLFSAWLRQLPRQLLREHPLLVAAAIAGTTLLILAGTDRLAGGYSEVDTGPASLSLLWLKVRVFTARLAEAVAFLPLFFAVPWLAHELVKPRRPETAVLAVLSVAVVVLFFSFYVTYPANDRYLTMLVPPVAIAFVCAVWWREVSWWAVGLTGALIARAVATVGIYPDDGPFSFFTAPGAQFFKRVILNKLEMVLPFGDAQAMTIALVLIVLGAILLALRSKLPKPAPTLILTGFAVLVVTYSAIGAVYTMQKFTYTSGLSHLTFAQQSYVDEAAGARAVGMLAAPPFEPGIQEQAFNASYFNGSLAASVGREGSAVSICCPRHRDPEVDLTIDPANGNISSIKPVPPLLLSTSGWLPYGLAGDTIAAGYDGLRLQRLGQPPRAGYLDLGPTYPDGWTKAGQPARLRLFPRSVVASRGTCLTATVETAPSITPGESTSVVIAGDVSRATKTLPSGAREQLLLRLPDRAAYDVRFSALPPGRLIDGRAAGGRLSDVNLIPCPA